MNGLSALPAATMPLVLSDTFTSDEKVPRQMELCDLVAFPAVRWTCDTGHGFNRQRLLNNAVIIQAKFHYAS